MRTRAAVTIKSVGWGRPRPGFTLIEVLVVVAIIALLVSILLPSMARAREMARRAICASRLHNMGVSVHEYSHDNKGKIIECRAASLSSENPSKDPDGYAASIQVCINPRRAAPGTAGAKPEDLVDWQGVAKRYHLDRELWECPNRPGAFFYEGNASIGIQGYDNVSLRSKGYKVRDDDNFNQWMLGYQYFGGMVEWKNERGAFKSRSPRDANSKPQWALAADSLIKVDGQPWGGGIDRDRWENIPPHPAASGEPDGGNILTFDGAVSWVRFGRMRYIHDWQGNGTRKSYWYQSDLGDFARR